jgi:hypothetical protein
MKNICRKANIRMHVNEIFPFLEGQFCAEKADYPD